MTTDTGALDAAAALISRSRYLICLVGAGISAESGIPTFRGPDGLWTRLGEPSNNQYQKFLEDPVAWWQQRRAGTGHRRGVALGSREAQPGPLRARRARMPWES